MDEPLWVVRQFGFGETCFQPVVQGEYNFTRWMRRNVMWFRYASDISTRTKGKTKAQLL